ncbi:TolC family protein [Undibacterium sp. Ren11W]|uniref:TolC family protein n=1 Tax=Undibacterium sp. Ren11W TaxID=3413045 RepID=UPI003BF2EE0A
MKSARAFFLLLTTLSAAATATATIAQTVSQATVPNTAHHAVKAMPYNADLVHALSALPPEQAVRKTLENLPQLRSGALGIELANSGKTRLQAGQYEWTLRATAKRRSEQNGERFNEQELTLERPVRWFGKAAKDLAIGDKGIELAHAAQADLWHEASRSLMKDWFDSLRESAGIRRLGEQLTLAEQLRGIAEKRVKAGDAAQLELLMADTETRRVSILLQQAQLREEQIRQMLETNYPGLPQPRLEQLPVPATLTESASFWQDKIMDDNHELELAQAEADLFNLQAGRIASDKMPDPTVGVLSSREQTQNGGQTRMLGISISIPLPGGARSAEASNASLKARMAAERVTQARLKVYSAAQRVITDSKRSHAIWQTMQQIQQQSLTQASKMMSAYKLGEASLSEALATRRQALDATLASESAQIDALAALARLLLDAHLIWSIDQVAENR